MRSVRLLLVLVVGLAEALLDEGVDDIVGRALGAGVERKDEVEQVLLLEALGLDLGHDPQLHLLHAELDRGLLLKGRIVCRKRLGLRLLALLAGR
eukprot:6272764-Prymnesium_polylepis.1